MQTYRLVVLLASVSFCLVNGYGPPPSKTKHRTTTTTTESPDQHSYEANSPTSNSIFPSGSPVTQSGSGPYPYNGPVAPNNIPNSQQSPAGNNYWWQGPSSPFNPQQSPPSVPPNQLPQTANNQYPNQGPNSAIPSQFPANGQGSYTNQPHPGQSGSYQPQPSPSGSYPNQGSPSHQGTLNPNQQQPSGFNPNQGSPSGSSPNQGSPTGTYPSQGIPSGSYPNQGPLSGLHPNQGSPTGSQPHQGTPSGSYPNSGSPSGSYPNQGAPTGSQPHQGTPSGSYPNPGSPSGSYPNQAAPTGSQPHQGTPSGSYPNPGSPSGSYPNQGSSAGSQPHQGTPSGSYPNAGSPSGSYPNQGSPAGSQPHQGIPSGSYPNSGSPSGSYPNQGAPTVSQPHQGIPSGSYPNSGSPSGSYPNQGAPTVSQPHQGTPSGSYPNPGSPSGSYPNQGSPPGSQPHQGTPSGSYPNPGSPSGSYPNQSSPAGSQPHQGTPSGSYPNPGSPSGSYPSQGSPSSSYPTNQGLPENPSSPSQPSKPIDISNNPFLSSALGSNIPSSCGSYSGGCANKPNLGQPQYPGSQSQSHLGIPEGQASTYPQVKPQSPLTHPSYPKSPTQQPQYGSNSLPSSNKFPPSYPGSNVNVPAGEPCNVPGHVCVTKSACNQGVLAPNGVPRRGDTCDANNEVCCRIAPNQNGAGTPPGNTVGYNNAPAPGAGTNGIPIGGSIYDKPTQPTYVTPSPSPYTGPLNTTPHPGCAAALKCVPIAYCTAEGVMADSPVYLTREQNENRVPLTDCVNMDTRVIGKCCRDPNYKDPWPAGMMMAKNPTDDGQFDDGLYHPPGVDNKFDDGQYHPPEQEASDSISHQAGIYYNSDATTPKGHTIKKPIGNFNQKPTPFPNNPPSPGRLPAPVHEDEYAGKNERPAPSNEIVPPEQQPQSNGYNVPNQQQPQRPLFPTQTPDNSNFAPNANPQSGYQQPTNPSQPGHTTSPYNQQPNPNHPTQPLFQPNEQSVPPYQNVPSTATPQQPNNANPSGSHYTISVPQNGQSPFPPTQFPPGSTCGVRHQSYSSKPDEAGESEFPWQALVTSAGNKTLLCGAAIVSENAVITAAHCVEDYKSKDLIIKAGVLKLFNPSEGAEQIRPVKAIARHSQFDAGSLAKDLAVLVVAPSFNPSQHVDKICLPRTSGNPANSNNCVVTGWGRQALKGPVPNSILHKIDVHFVDGNTCENTLRGTHLGKYFILNKGFSCAVPKSSSDLCKVDVGGPLACDRGDGKYELAGVNSWDVNCPADETPTVFSNPEAEWIQQIVQTPIEKLEADEEAYNINKSRGESLEQVNIDEKPGFALGYGK